MISDVVFDCFGTLVQYTPDGRDVEAPDSYQVALGLGFQGSYGAFAAAWDDESRRLDDHSRRTGREYPMEIFASAFVARHIGSNVDPTGVERLTAAYLAEWRRCVRPDPEADAVVGELAPRYRLSIITNTHHPPLVREVLEETGIQEAFAQVVMSAEVGFRKPHPAIFRHALDRLQVPAVQAVFVGDTYEDDLLGAAAIGMHAVLIDPHNRYADRGLQRVARLGEVPGWLRTLAGA